MQGFPGCVVQFGTGVENLTFAIGLGRCSLIGPKGRLCSLLEQVLQNLKPAGRHWKQMSVATFCWQS